MKYFKKVFLGCLLWVLLVGVDVNAASTCDYSEQVQLSNYAAAIKMNYEKKRVYFDVNGNYYDTLPEEAYSENAGYDDYGFMDKALVNILNMTDDIYIHVKGSNNFEQTFYYKDMKDGVLEFDGGDFSEIVNYKITIYSNSPRCKGDNLRTIDYSTPMRNHYSDISACADLPNYEFCQEFITTPFYASESEITKRIGEEYSKLQQKKEEEKNKSFWDNLSDFISEHRTIIISVVVVIIIGGALSAIVILKKRRSRIL